MARLTDEQKAKARTDFEVNGLSQNEIAKKYGIGKATVSRMVNNDGWQAKKMEHLVVEKKSAIKTLQQVEHKMERLNSAFQIAIDARVYSELQAEGIFLQAAIENQYLANMTIKEMFKGDDGLNIMALESHSRLTARNKETVLGKSHDTQVNIQNNVPERIERVIIDPKNAD